MAERPMPERQMAERHYVMGRGRLEAFSDGVIAIIITIMVLELKVPHGHDLEALRPLVPMFLSYILSFTFIGIYWTNHHHLLHAVQHVSGATLWANLHLLFWLSLVPLTTAWLGDSGFERWPVALYGIVMIGAGQAYSILIRCLLASHPVDSALARAIGSDFKGKMSHALYALAVVLSFFMPIVSCLIFVVVAVMWLIPDRRIERTLNESRD